jgi:DNA (cytosine-5)-methyltransferase 1
MGFDAPGRSDFLIKVSDMQAYKQFGNSVAVPAVAAVASYLKPFLDRALAREKEMAGKQKASS